MHDVREDIYKMGTKDKVKSDSLEFFACADLHRSSSIGVEGSAYSCRRASTPTQYSRVLFGDEPHPDVLVEHHLVGVGHCALSNPVDMAQLRRIDRLRGEAVSRGSIDRLTNLSEIGTQCELGSRTEAGDESRGGRGRTHENIDAHAFRHHELGEEEFVPKHLFDSQHSHSEVGRGE